MPMTWVMYQDKCNCLFTCEHVTRAFIAALFVISLELKQFKCQLQSRKINCEESPGTWNNVDTSHRYNVEQKKLNTNGMVPFIKVQKEAQLSHDDRS